jgi:hypothetical protein
VQPHETPSSRYQVRCQGRWVLSQVRHYYHSLPAPWGIQKLFKNQIARDQVNLGNSDGSRQAFYYELLEP